MISVAILAWFFAFAATGGGGYTGDLLHETFNTASGAGPGGLGYDTAFSETAGTPNENYITHTANGSGEALHMNASAASQTTLSPVWADRDEYWGAFFIRILAYPGAIRRLFRGRLNGANQFPEILMDSNGDLIIDTGPDVSPTDLPALDTWYCVYFHILRDTDGGGASASASIEFTETPFAKTGTGPKFNSTAVGTQTTQMDQLAVDGQFSTSGTNYVIDGLVLSTTDNINFATNPWTP